MLGAIIGDIAGSTREWQNIKTEDFELIPQGSHFTDDTVMTLAVADWLMKDPLHSEKALIECMQTLGRRYPNAGYGGMFRKWLVSDNPKPYMSYGNGSAMRVSPVGLYAKSLDEALELARITATVTHNHPEGIKGAQAIAACIFLKLENESDWKIKEYIEQKFGYNLDAKLEDIRDEYSFDVTCQGSVPIAIMAFLQRNRAIKCLRLAISMGGDSDTIGGMACAIAMAHSFNATSSAYMPKEVIEQCRVLLPLELLDINDRFEAFINRPLYQSYYVTGSHRLFAGEYPGAKDEKMAKEKINQMIRFGIKHFIDLTEEGELNPYRQWLPEGITYTRFPIKDLAAPSSTEEVYELIQKIKRYCCQSEELVYIHCYGGVGRTGTVVACTIAECREQATVEEVLKTLRNYFSEMPKSAYRKSPEMPAQFDFISRFVADLPRYQQKMKERIPDCIRGCLMAGAAGDALGYPVEFMDRKAIFTRYGKKGITAFEFNSNGKALVSDDTQMTLFTANGILMGITRGYMRGIGGCPEEYVAGAYLDWYYTQTGRKKEMFQQDLRCTWLRDLPRLAHRRAPGITCLNACESLCRKEEVCNNSKGCGGIMRVAPVALLDAGYAERGNFFYTDKERAEAGAEIAWTTHKHPLGFLPAALFTHLIFRLIPLSASQAGEEFPDIVNESVELLESIYIGEYEYEKKLLADLTRKALVLAYSEISDEEAISQLGQGWTGEEAWAIAVYCSARHIGNMEKAITAAVNHDGDSDSTGSLTGNIMGAIYGYRAMLERNLFCPVGYKFENVLELSDIILTLADDLATGCIISEYDSIDTPEKQRWYTRYCEMEPMGVSICPD